MHDSTLLTSDTSRVNAKYERQRSGNALADPILEIRYVNGTLIASNDDWKQTQQSSITATGLAPPNDLESAIVGTLTPGNYTAIARGFDNTIGNALIEVCALD